MRLLGINREYFSFILPAHRLTNRVVELVASFAPPIFAAIGLVALQMRSPGFLSAFLSIPHVSRGAQLALLAASGALISASFLRREVALFAQSANNVFGLFSGIYAAVSLVNAYGRGQTVSSVVLVTGFVAFAALLNAPLYLYSKQPPLPAPLPPQEPLRLQEPLQEPVQLPFFEALNFSNPFNALRQLNKLIVDSALSQIQQKALFEVRKGLIHRILNDPQSCLDAFKMANIDSDERREIVMQECTPGLGDPDRHLVSFCLNLWLAWCFERSGRRFVYAFRPTRLAYIESLLIKEKEFEVYKKNIEERFRSIKAILLGLIGKKDIQFRKFMLGGLRLPDLVTEKIFPTLSPTMSSSLEIVDLHNLNFPFREDWEVLFTILQHTGVASQPNWERLKTFCQEKLQVDPNPSGSSPPRASSVGDFSSVKDPLLTRVAGAAAPSLVSQIPGPAHVETPRGAPATPRAPAVAAR